MNHDELQVENGNFTRIVNPLIEHLIKIPFKGCELAVALYIIRKTYGFHKKQDEISLSQFEKDLNRSRQTIVTALKNLQLVNVARLVKKGESRLSSNIWSINKYHDTWELVNMARLVQRKRGTSLTEAPKLVYTARHTKDNTKDIQKKYSAEGAEVIKSFELIDSKNKTYYNNKTQREASDFLIREYGKDKVLKAIELIKVKRGSEFFPSVTSPYELKEKWTKIAEAMFRQQSELKPKSSVAFT